MAGAHDLAATRGSRCPCKAAKWVQPGGVACAILLPADPPLRPAVAASPAPQEVTAFLRGMPNAATARGYDKLAYLDQRLWVLAEGWVTLLLLCGPMCAAFCGAARRSSSSAWAALPHPQAPQVVL